MLASDSRKSTIIGLVVHIYRSRVFLFFFGPPAIAHLVPSEPLPVDFPVVYSHSCAVSVSVMVLVFVRVVHNLKRAFQMLENRRLDNLMDMNFQPSDVSELE